MQVRKEQIESFTGENLWPPHSHFKAVFSGDLSINPVLKCEVKLVGAKQPNKFNVNLNLSQGDYSDNFVQKEYTMT